MASTPGVSIWVSQLDNLEQPISLPLPRAVSTAQLQALRKSDRKARVTKRIAIYNAEMITIIKVGRSALVFPLAHPDNQLTLTKHVMTSPVVFHDRESGVFETENTIYYPKYPSRENEIQ